MKHIFANHGRPGTLLSVSAVVTLKINKCFYVSINEPGLLTAFVSALTTDKTDKRGVA